MSNDDLLKLTSYVKYISKREQISLADDISKPKDITEGKMNIPTNCKNCGALLPKIKFGNMQCEYCHTTYYF